MSIAVNWTCPKCGLGHTTAQDACDFCGFIRPKKPSG